MHEIERAKDIERERYYIELELCNGKCVDHERDGDKNGYAMVEYMYKGKRSDVYLHRVIYSNFFEVPLEELDGVVIRHMCDNPRCMNPWHLEPGTPADNSNDASRRYRLRSGEQSPMSKLNWDIVFGARERHENGESISSLAKEFGVSYTTMASAVKGRTWKAPERVDLI